MADEVTREISFPGIPQGIDDELKDYLLRMEEIIREIGIGASYLSDVTLQRFSTEGDGFKDEDDLVSDSDTAALSQQSAKAYIDAQDTALNAALVTANCMTYDGTLIYNGSAPSTYTDLNIATAASITAQKMFVHLAVKNTSATKRSYVFRTNGQSESGPEASSSGGGTGLVDLEQNDVGYVSLITDANGIIEWHEPLTTGNHMHITLLAWQKLQTQ